MSDNAVGRIEWTWVACDSCIHRGHCDTDDAEVRERDGYMRCLDYESAEADE